jgi:hypothetical protein
MPRARSEIQSVVFEDTPRRPWQAIERLQWLAKHELRPIKKEHEAGPQHRYRLAPPERFARFTTKPLTTATGHRVLLVLGWRA